MDKKPHPISSQYLIFSDVSFDPGSKSGLAGVTSFVHHPNALFPENPIIRTKAFDRTNCSRLELQSIIWALSDLQPMELKMPIALFTDSQTACDLPARRPRLEAANFRNKGSGNPLSNGDLYREIFLLMDDLNVTFNWIKGHKPRSQHDDSDRIFSMVDRLTRKKLRSSLDKQG
jgi:ribonuclease HI